MADSTKRVLIVEDEKSMAKALELKLNSVDGLEAKAVHNGAQGLEALKEGTFHVILLDLVMPEMDGFTFLEEMKKAGKKIPVIVSTNLSQEEDEKRARDLGAVDFFVKSNTPITEVVDHVKKALKL